MSQGESRSFFRQIGETFRGYNGLSFRDDVIAGLSVGVVAVPQAMAYAIIAEVPPVYGLYTLIFQTLIGAIFNSHPLLSLGPVNSQSLVVASIATRLLSPGDEAAYLTLVVTLTLMKGIFQLAMAVLQFGQLSRYVSRSAVVGFTAGAGVLIFAKQLGPFLGFATHRQPSDLPGLIGICQQIFRGAAEANPIALAVGGMALAIVVVGRLISRKVPGPLIAVVVGALLVALVGWTGEDLNLLGALPVWPESWPSPQLDPGMLERLIPAGLALALLGAIETHAIAKILAERTDHPINSNQDLFGQGITNALTAFVGCIPGSTSVSRSALNESSGGKTLIANLVNAGFVAVVLVLFADAARYIPMAAIAGVLLFVAFGLVDWRYIRRAVKTSRGDAAVLLVTFLATLTIPLEYAVLVGVALSLALYLRRATELQIQEMVPGAEGVFLERPLSASSGNKAVTFVQLEGSLFFAQADEFEEKLQALLRSPVKVVVFRLRRVHSIDATMLGVLDRFARSLTNAGRHVVLCGIHTSLMGSLEDFGIVKLIGTENVFPTDTAGIFASAEAALQRAADIVSVSD
ncbi:MAG: SulP family sulfate permease [Pirellulaceae bacterium]